MIEWLVDYQFAQDWSDSEMAAELGISRVYWNLLKNRRARPGPKVVRATLSRFPEATNLVMRTVGAAHVW